MATLSDLERMLSDESEGPKALPLSLLLEITKDFSDDLKIGSGGFAVVYKGILGNGLVAVKRLDNSYMHEKEFLQEVECLMKVKHQNVVRFLGYCADTQGIAETYNGNFVMADVQERLFCFEYVPNGNLGAYISDASHGLEWRKRYEIIKGICEGLNYLHQNNIVHSDLNPANILLDNNMMPKIADFGVSRCFRDNQSGDILTKVVGTLGYMAPEFYSGKIKLKSDIYSLGVIITEIVTGMRHTEDEDVIEIWRNRLEKSKEHSQLEQVKVCVKLGTECTEFNPGKRPATQLIIDRLAETKSTVWSIKTAVSLTAEQGEKASNELRQSTRKLPGDGSSESYNDGEHVLPSKSSMTSGPCSVTSLEPEGMHRAAQVGETSRHDADTLQSNCVKLPSKASDDFVVTIGGSGNPMQAECKYSREIIQCSTTNMTGILSNHIKSASCGGIFRANRQLLPNPSNIADATATGAGMGDKQFIENLHLSWKGFSAYPGSEPSSRREMEKSLPTEALECLELHNNLKHLRISGYNVATSPSWFASNMSVTSLKTLHLEDCGEWRILPSLERLPFLAKLKLSGMPEVIEVSVPSLKELVLVEMPKLETCSCISMRGLNSRLRVLQIKECPELKVFDLFGNGDKFEVEQKSWLPRLCELIIHNCPHLRLPQPVPSSSTVSRISMSRVSKFPKIEALSCQILTIGKDSEDDDFDVHSYNEGFYHEISDELFVLDGGILAFHNLRLLTHLIVGFCRNLTSIPFNGLRQLVSLKKLKIIDCPGLSMLDVLPENGHEDLTPANYNVFPSLEYLHIDSCGIAWGCLSLMLEGAPVLRELDLSFCGCLESLHLHYCTALERVTVLDCCLLGEVKGLHKLQSLRNFDLSGSRILKSLQLHSCTALEELDASNCYSLEVLEGLESLSSLRRLIICNALELLSGQQGYEQCPRLKSLEIDDFNALTTSFFCKQHASLERLHVVRSEVERLTEEQESELLLLSSLEDLEFSFLPYLEDLPAGLHSYPSLKRLAICKCPRISRLPEKGLPPSLEKLETWLCSDELNNQCRMLASSKLLIRTVRT